MKFDKAISAAKVKEARCPASESDKHPAAHATVIDSSRKVREVVRDVARAPDPVFRFRVWGSVFRVLGLGLKVWGVG